MAAETSAGMATTHSAIIIVNFIIIVYIGDEALENKYVCRLWRIGITNRVAAF
jgi:hypothetical protein